MKKFLLFLLTIVGLTSCSKFSDGTSVWAGGLWVIPWLTFSGSLAFFIQTYMAVKSGTEGKVPNKHGGSTHYEDLLGVKTKFWNVGRFWFGVALLVATIAIIIYQNSQK